MWGYNGSFYRKRDRARLEGGEGVCGGATALFNAEGTGLG